MTLDCHFLLGDILHRIHWQLPNSELSAGFAGSGAGPGVDAGADAHPWDGGAAAPNARFLCSRGGMRRHWCLLNSNSFPFKHRKAVIILEGWKFGFENVRNHPSSSYNKSIHTWQDPGYILDPGSAPAGCWQKSDGLVIPISEKVVEYIRNLFQNVR